MNATPNDGHYGAGHDGVRLADGERHVYALVTHMNAVPAGSALELRYPYGARATQPIRRTAAGWEVDSPKGKTLHFEKTAKLTAALRGTGGVLVLLAPPASHDVAVVVRSTAEPERPHEARLVAGL